jgi:hypothetical protein
MSLDELDSILDAESGSTAKTFRTVNGYCKIYPDRIELQKDKDDVSRFLTSPYFILRMVFILALLAFVGYMEIYRRQAFSPNYYAFLVPIVFLVFSLFGNINLFFYRLRAILFILFVLFFAYWDYNDGNTKGAILYLVFGVMLGSALVRSFDYSYDPVIYRRDILSVRFINSIPYITQAYFLLHFRKEEGKVKKRPVILPGAFRKGEKEKKWAYELMKSEGLLGETENEGK